MIGAVRTGYTMTSFFLLLSFLIHAILFISIYHLYEKTKKDKNDQVKRLEEILSEFMKSIQLENEKLEKKIYESEIRQQVLNNHSPNVHHPTEINNHDSKKFSDIIESVPKAMPRSEKPLDEANRDWDTSKYVDNRPKDIVETSIEGQVLQLFKEGKSSEEIAKQLNRGKTEVDLYIKLNKLSNN